MKKKVKILSVAVILGLLAVYCFRAGEFLREHLAEGRDTVGRLTAASEERNENLIVLDPGHGGIDGGKIGVNGAEEKEINLKISLKIKETLENAGMTVVMTREDDQRLAESQVEDLKKRASLMNEQNAVLTVSIHQNSYHEAGVSGAQVFYYTDSAEGKLAAQILQEALKGLDPENTKEEKGNNTYYILKQTEVPVVIVECGFLSNYSDAEKLTDDSYQQELAKAIAKGISEYIRCGMTPASTGGE